MAAAKKGPKAARPSHAYRRAGFGGPSVKSVTDSDVLEEVLGMHEYIIKSRIPEYEMLIKNIHNWQASFVFIHMEDAIVVAEHDFREKFNDHSRTFIPFAEWAGNMQYYVYERILPEILDELLADTYDGC